MTYYESQLFLEKFSPQSHSTFRFNSSIIMRSIYHFLLFCSITIFTMNSFASSRLKDILDFEGVRDNILVGYGLVVGLNGTGDNLKNSAFTEKGLVDFLEKLGVNTRGSNLKTKNVAAVMVTATLPSFARTGAKISVNISTLGDARSLKGGTLIATPLLAADGEVYAVAQGSVSIGALSSLEPNKTNAVLTSGYVNNGAIIEREVKASFNSNTSFKLSLKNPDISTSRSIATVINEYMQDENVAIAEDPGTVSVAMPNSYKNDAMSFFANIENLMVETNQKAKIVIDEATGTIVMNNNVKIDKVAVSQGNLMVKISDEQEFVQSLVNASKSKKNPEQEQRANPGTNFAILEQGTTLSDLVNGLNALAVKTQDLIAILRAIQQSGALQAEIEVR